MPDEAGREEGRSVEVLDSKACELDWDGVVSYSLVFRCSSELSSFDVAFHSRADVGFEDNVDTEGSSAVVPVRVSNVVPAGISSPLSVLPFLLCN